LPKTVTRQRRDCDLNPGPAAPESSTSNHSAELVEIGRRNLVGINVRPRRERRACVVASRQQSVIRVSPGAFSCFHLTALMSLHQRIPNEPAHLQRQWRWLTPFRSSACMLSVRAPSKLGRRMHPASLSAPITRRRKAAREDDAFQATGEQHTRDLRDERETRRRLPAGSPGEDAAARNGGRPQIIGTS